MFSRVLRWCVRDSSRRATRRLPLLLHGSRKRHGCWDRRDGPHDSVQGWLAGRAAPKPGEAKSLDAVPALRCKATLFMPRHC